MQGYLSYEGEALCTKSAIVLSSLWCPPHSLHRGIFNIKHQKQLATPAHHLADYPAMSFFFVCWHSRKWWPPIRGGTLQSALLWLENVKWDDYFCKKSISHTNYWWKSKKQYKKRAKPPKKTCLFHACPKIPEMRDPSKWKFPKRGIPQNGNFQNEGSLKIEISKMRDCLRRWPTDGAACSCVKSD